jgi:ABC-type antimicrobial peptide transport system permease subunit
MALGASPSHLARTVTCDIARHVATGLAIGLPLAFVSARAAGALLFGVTPSAPGIYVLSTCVLVSVSAVAAAGPAWRASSIDPSQALRAE